MKKTICLVLSLLFTLVSIIGCGAISPQNTDAINTDTENKPNTEQVTETGSPKKEPKIVNIDDIDWEVYFDKSQRYTEMVFTNKSELTVVYFELGFKEKVGISEKEKSEYFDAIIEKLYLNPEDPEDAEDIEELKKEPISMNVKAKYVAKTGETTPPARLFYYSGSYYVRDFGHYSLVEPDYAIIKYIEGEDIYTVNYDFETKRHREENKTEQAYYWTNSGLKNSLPKPDADYVTKDWYDSESHFSFKVYGWTIKQYKSYIQECIDFGFTTEINEYSDNDFTAKNSTGLKISLSYDDDDYCMKGEIEVIKTNNE